MAFSLACEVDHAALLPSFLMLKSFRVCSTLCDPYLNLFRGIIPPLNGTIDLSPILAFVALDVSTFFLAYLYSYGLPVSQQVIHLGMCVHQLQV